MIDSDVTVAKRQRWLRQMATTPEMLGAAVSGLTEELIQLYAWHGLHHTAHITGLRERRGW